MSKRISQNDFKVQVSGQFEEAYRGPTDFRLFCIKTDIHGKSLPDETKNDQPYLPTHLIYLQFRIFCDVLRIMLASIAINDKNMHFRQIPQ